MAITVFVIDTDDLSDKLSKEAKKVFKATTSGRYLLIKSEDFHNATDYWLKKKNSFKIGLADIGNKRIDFLYSPNPIFSEKFDEMLRAEAKERGKNS